MRGRVSQWHADARQGTEKATIDKHSRPPFSVSITGQITDRKYFFQSGIWKGHFDTQDKVDYGPGSDVIEPAEERGGSP